VPATVQSAGKEIENAAKTAVCLPGGYRMPSDVMTIAEVAADLRCSKAHVYNAINGRVAGVTALPAICMGRRKLVRQTSLEVWKGANEKALERDMLPASLEVGAVDAPRRKT
jgi:hypothetical protein